ncbi:PREDICTED: uncharacterized protein LOC108766502 [Trachymyrmex cornetzi]|nr:PREDICTED: uncharacterized protein LOC108766502 [Trachymyrmex cornetzi]
MERVRAAIDLRDVGIASSMKLRKSAAGGLLLEVTGPGSKLAADRLADAMRDVIFATDEDERGVTIGRPKRRVELRISGFDESIDATVVRSEVALEGLCSSAHIRVGDVEFSRRGLGSVWVQCPADASLALAKAGHLKLGWAKAKVELLKGASLRCYRCLAVGHVQQRCPSVMDRSRCCFNYGRHRHVWRSCKDRPRCPVCEDRGLPSAHRAGAAGLCRPV